MVESNQPFRQMVPQEPNTNQPQISVDKSNIKVPIDVQDALEIVESITASALTPVTITMDGRGYGFKQVLGVSSGVTTRTFLVEFSFDNVTWFTDYTSGVPEVSINRTQSSTARYWRLTATDTLPSGGTVSLVLGATLSS